MAVLQNQWQLNGGNIVDGMRAQYLCARFACYETNPTHALMIYAVILGSAEKQKIVQKRYKISQNKEPSVEQLSYVCLYGTQNADFFFQIISHG